MHTCIHMYVFICISYQTTGQTKPSNNFPSIKTGFKNYSFLIIFKMKGWTNTSMIDFNFWYFPILLQRLFRYLLHQQKKIIIHFISQSTKKQKKTVRTKTSIHYQSNKESCWLQLMITIVSMCFGIFALFFFSTYVSTYLLFSITIIVYNYKKYN